MPLPRLLSIVFIFCALFLNGLVSISLPCIKSVYTVKTHFGNATVQSSQGFTDIADVSFGIWALCYYDSQHNSTCSGAVDMKPYTFTIITEDKSLVTIVEASWTRGLLVHFVAFVIAVVAWVSVIAPFKLKLIPFGVTLLATMLTLAAWAADIIFFSSVRDKINTLGVGNKTEPGPGFWMTFGSLVILACASLILWFDYIQSRML